MSEDKFTYAAIQLIRAVGDTIRDLGEVPSGHLYARLMDRINERTYNAIIDQLKRAKLVEQRGYRLIWIGPPAPDKNAPPCANCSHPKHSHEHGIGPNGSWCGRLGCNCRGYEVSGSAGKPV